MSLFKDGICSLNTDNILYTYKKSHQSGYTTVFQGGIPLDCDKDPLAPTGMDNIKEAIDKLTPNEKEQLRKYLTQEDI